MFKKTVAALVMTGAFISPLAVNVAPAAAVSGWTTYATVRSTDEGITRAGINVDVRNPYSFRVRVKASPSQKVEVRWSYYCENKDRSETFTVSANNSTWVTKTLPRPTNPGDHCSVYVDLDLPQQEYDEVGTIRAQLQVKTR